MNRPLTVLVCGSRSFNDRARVYRALDGLPVVHLVHGGASGADAIADEWAKERRIPVQAFPARWKEYGAAAGPIRNTQMLRQAKPDVVVAFPGGKGTRDMCKKAAREGIPIVYP
jgi:hypothetical protein